MLCAAYGAALMNGMDQRNGFPAGLSGSRLWAMRPDTVPAYLTATEVQLFIQPINAGFLTANLNCSYEPFSRIEGETGMETRRFGRTTT